jgi:hypothetical protein
MSATVLSDDVLNGLLKQPQFQGLPCLQFLKMSPRRKPCNCSRDAGARLIEGEHARICVFQLQPARLLELKKALGADQLVLYMNTPGFPKRAVL